MLAANESYWLDAMDLERRLPPLEGEVSVDVLCVGGGYTSLVTAYLLKKREPSLAVAVVEASYVGFGSSGRNGGMVLQEPHLERVRRRGADAVRFTYAQAVRSVDFIDTLAREEGFDCELERSGYLEVALWPRHEQELGQTQRACGAIGIELEVLDRAAMRETIRSDRFLGALRFPKAAMLHPGKYISGLKQAVLRRGVLLFENTPVESIRQAKGSIAVQTPTGRVTARRLVLGLNAYLDRARLRVIRPRAVALFSFIILTEPLPQAKWHDIGWAGREGYTDKRRIHNYVRLTGDRILFGGRVRYHFGLDSPQGISHIYDKLRAEMLLTFPSLHDVTISHRWSGPVAITWRRTPSIGRTGDIHYALGYSGMGVSLATLAGRVLADRVQGYDEPWQELLYVSDPIAALPPEPFRFLGFQGGYYGMRLMDFLDRLR